MADSFFGFNTGQPVEDDGGGGIEEDDYDALNDETFGLATNGDWEAIHENLVELDQNGNTNGDDKDHDADIADLDFNLARVGLEDCEEVADDNETRVQLDPSVWAHPIKPQVNAASPFAEAFRQPNVDPHLRQNFPMIPPHHLAHFQQQQLLQRQHQQQQQQHHHHQQQQQQQQQRQQQQQQQQHQQQQNLLEKLQQSNAMPMAPPKILSVEDIERNIRSQQQMQQNQDQIVKPPTPQLHQMMQQQQQQQQQFQRPVAPPGLALPKPPLGPALNMQLPPGLQKQPHQRLPPGFPPMNMMNQNTSGLPPSMQPNMGRPMPPNVPIPMPGNFPMHPNFNAMRSGTPLPHPGLPPQQQQQQQLRVNQAVASLMPNQSFSGNQQSMMQSVNQFNKRLVQEIQNNHPMMPFNRMNNNQYQNNSNNNNASNNMGGYQQNHHNYNNRNQQHQQNRMANGHLDKEYDEYANLMSNRDKQWLIGIQLTQLNTGTPYIDDYYYTVYKERKAKARGQKENKAHKDNQMNHPLTQPKGHAHLVLISMGNKNGGNQQRNNHNGRERKNSESKDKDTPRTYTPLQFENSLGKLQCGSVTAPRKIIDMDVVGADSANSSNPTNEISVQRKSRQILMHIETLYRIALKLEDFENPTAIATALIVKERKEKERQLALDLERAEALIAQNKENQENANVKPVSTSNSIRSSLSLSDKPEETKEELMARLLGGLAAEKVAQMIIIRKGKTLMKRVLPLVQDQMSLMNIWCAIFTALPLVVKKDKDDNEGHMFALFAEFQAHIQNASVDDVLRISQILTATDKLGFVFLNKFSISCVVVLLLKLENFYSVSSNIINTTQQTTWLAFLTALTESINKNANVLTTTATFERDVLKPLVSHFARFRDLKSQPLLTVLTQRTVTN